MPTTAQPPLPEGEGLLRQMGCYIRPPSCNHLLQDTFSLSDIVTWLRQRICTLDSPHSPKCRRIRSPLYSTLDIHPENSVDGFFSLYPTSMLPDEIFPCVSSYNKSSLYEISDKRIGRVRLRWGLILPVSSNSRGCSCPRDLYTLLFTCTDELSDIKRFSLWAYHLMMSSVCQSVCHLESLIT